MSRIIVVLFFVLSGCGDEPFGHSCTTDTQCGTGWVCQEPLLTTFVAAQPSYCTKTCAEGEASCPAGYSCVTFPSASDVLPRCLQD